MSRSCYSNDAGGAIYLSRNNIIQQLLNTYFKYCDALNGGGAVFAGSDIQKIFLDVHTSRAHVANNPVSFSRNYGAMQLGVENTDYFV